MTVSLFYCAGMDNINDLLWFPAEKKTIEDSKVMTLTQGVSVSAESCPSVISAFNNPPPSLTAICTEITYQCKDESHVLQFSQNDELCLKRGKASKHCDMEVEFEPPTCKGTLT